MFDTIFFFQHAFGHTFKRDFFFSKIICFEQSNFQLFLAHMFIMDISFTNFVYNCMKLDLINWELGTHTNIIQRGKISMFCGYILEHTWWEKILQTSVVFAGTSKWPYQQLIKAKKALSLNACLVDLKKKIQLFFQLDMGFQLSAWGRWAWCLISCIDKAKDINSMDTT